MVNTFWNNSFNNFDRFNIMKYLLIYPLFGLLSQSLNKLSLGPKLIL